MQYWRVLFVPARSSSQPYLLLMSAIHKLQSGDGAVSVEAHGNGLEANSGLHDLKTKIPEFGSLRIMSR